MYTKVGLLLLIFVFVVSIVLGLFIKHPALRVHTTPKTLWQLQSIDTMKYSRDMARDKAGSTSFRKEIDTQVKQISAIGATHIAIATPYDKEFLPFLSDWVAAARRYKLHVWFRGNFSGWEGWFDYPKMSRQQHTKLTEEFILNNAHLFEDGDIFTSCPECENGGPGDPRKTQDIQGHRDFLISEYHTSQSAFNKIKKLVDSNYYSMNGDVAELIMDEATTSALDGIVVIDHYVLTPEKLNRDINDIAKQSGGKIVLGEFGAPIPDIHGYMTDDEQNKWVATLLGLVAENKNVIGVNYWTGHGSSTQIWNDDNTPRGAVETIRRFYKPTNIHGVVRDDIGRKLSDVTITVGNYSLLTNEHGQFDAELIAENKSIIFSKSGYKTATIDQKSFQGNMLSIVLYKNSPSLFESICTHWLAFLNKKYYTR